MKRTIIIGAGAMGGMIGAFLAKKSYDVTLLARGAHATAMQQSGLSLTCNHQKTTISVKVITSLKDAGTFDYIWLTVKAHQLTDIAADIPAIMAENATIIPAINGIPWWYFHYQATDSAAIRLTSLDPDGILSRYIPDESIIGCVNYLGGTITEPGVISHIPVFKPALVIGDPNKQTNSDRMHHLYNMLDDAGLMPEITTNIYAAIWHKLWGNAAFNPLGALTNGTMAAIANSYQPGGILHQAMHEAEMVANALGIYFQQTIAERVALAAKLTSHHTSMEQDILAVRQPETEAIIGSVREIAAQLGLQTPCLDMLYRLVELKYQIRAAQTAFQPTSHAA